MSGLCKDCRWWDEWFPIYYQGEQLQGWGECTAVFRLVDTRLVITDDNDCDGEMATCFDFGCVMFEERAADHLTPAGWKEIEARREADEKAALERIDRLRAELDAKRGQQGGGNAG